MSITLNLIQGLPFEYLITITDSDNTPIDITGSNIVMKIRETLISDIVSAELSTDNGRITFPDAVNGQFKLYLEPAVTETIINNSVFDIKLTLADLTTVYLIAEGSKIKTKQFVSR